MTRYQCKIMIREVSYWHIPPKWCPIGTDKYRNEGCGQCPEIEETSEEPGIPPLVIWKSEFEE